MLPTLEVVRKALLKRTAARTTATLPFVPTKIPPPEHVCSRARESQCHVSSAHARGREKAHGIVVLDGAVLDVRVRVAADVERGALGVRGEAVSSVRAHK